MKKLVVIGGGINGAGIARDAAMRGLQVTLLEKNDFGSGTSWASSKLIHGGLRYLEHGEIELVRESLREREILLRIHPHNIHPLHLLLPVYRYSPHRLITLRLGMTMYEFLSGNNSLPLHDVFTKEQLASAEPGLDQHSLLGGIAYWDAQCVYPERLVLANLHSAEAYGAQLFNYHKVIRLNTKSGRITSVVATDSLNGDLKEFEADIVVNAAGPWIDEITDPYKKIQRPLIGGTRGSHLVVPKFTDGPRHAIYVNARKDGRPFFILPWRDDYLIGTTDIRHTDSADQLSPTHEEIDYLLTETHHCFPNARLSRDQILFSFAGIRPLPYSTKKNPGAISRRHIIVDHTQRDGIANLVSLLGGKLTTYRRMAEQVVDLVFRKSGLPNVPCTTGHVPLWGGEMDHPHMFVSDNAASVKRLYRMDEKTFYHLVTLYGTHSMKVLETGASLNNGMDALSAYSLDVPAQVLFAVRYEWAKTLSDVMLRRTPIGTNARMGMDTCEKVAEVMGNTLGWSEKKRQDEISDYKIFVALRLWSHKS